MQIRAYIFNMFASDPRKNLTLLNKNFKIEYYQI